VLNARQSIAGPGRIVVRTARVDPKDASTDDGREFVKIEVEDTGSGIEPEVLEHIFDPYFTTRSAGTGLGLSMAYGIVKQSQGQMRVASRPGRGSVFSVLLPVSAPEELDAQAGDSTPSAVVVEGGEGVMIVDDRPEVTAFVSACLRRYGYHTIVYTDSEIALSAVRQGSASPHLVIRDVMMPGMPLQEFAARLRDLLPGVPMVFMSGLPEADLAPLLGGSAGYFISKPFTPEQLAALVRRVLDAAAILAAK
jgi:CheY-like chemotaxis protein